MSDLSEIAILQGEIEKTERILDRQDALYRHFLDTDFVSLGKSRTSAIVVAEVLTNFYTCSETLFLRISQFFENELRPAKWHADLLRKMTIEVKGVRAPVLSDSTYAAMDEVRRFRHFHRYYFEMEYDWDKLEFLQKKYESLRTLLRTDLQQFGRFLAELRDAMTDA